MRRYWRQRNYPSPTGAYHPELQPEPAMIASISLSPTKSSVLYVNTVVRVQHLLSILEVWFFFFSHLPEAFAC